MKYLMKSNLFVEMKTYENWEKFLKFDNAHYIKQIDKYIKFFLSLNIFNVMSNVKTELSEYDLRDYLETGKKLADKLDDYYDNCVKGDDDYLEYKDQFEKVSDAINSKMKVREINYRNYRGANPTDVVEDTNNRLKIHKDRINNFPLFSDINIICETHETPKNI